MFWGYHSKHKKDANFFPNELKSMLNAMLALNPVHRLTIAEIKAHPWYQGPVPTTE